MMRILGRWLGGMGLKVGDQDLIYSEDGDWSACIST